MDPSAVMLNRCLTAILLCNAESWHDSALHREEQVENDDSTSVLLLWHDPLHLGQMLSGLIFLFFFSRRGLLCGLPLIDNICSGLSCVFFLGRDRFPREKQCEPEQTEFCRQCFSIWTAYKCQIKQFPGSKWWVSKCVIENWCMEWKILINAIPRMSIPRM